MKAIELLAILNDPASELDWDGCWDVLVTRNEELKSCVPELLRILEGGTETAQIFALRKLRELNVDLALWEESLCRHFGERGLRGPVGSVGCGQWLSCGVAGPCQQ
jgi:hypothetical protein